MDEITTAIVVAPEAIKKLIIASKHINLASLLIGESMTDRSKFVDAQEGQIIIKANEPRLAQPLSIDEFRLAFSKFKLITCGKEGDPARLPEFNAYSDFIDSLHMQFGGTYFYQYHNAFSMKMEQYEAVGHPVSWALKDTESCLKVFASVKSN